MHSLYVFVGLRKYLRLNNCHLLLNAVRLQYDLESRALFLESLQAIYLQAICFSLIKLGNIAASYLIGQVPSSLRDDRIWVAVSLSWYNYITMRIHIMWFSTNILSQDYPKHSPWWHWFDSLLLEASFSNPWPGKCDSWPASNDELSRYGKFPGVVFWGLILKRTLRRRATTPIPFSLFLLARLLADSLQDWHLKF